MYKTLEEQLHDKIEEIRNLEREGDKKDEIASKRLEMQGIMKGTNIDLNKLEDDMEVIYVI